VKHRELVPVADFGHQIPISDEYVGRKTLDEHVVKCKGSSLLYNVQSLAIYTCEYIAHF
jgi:hypothetical protein